MDQVVDRALVVVTEMVTASPGFAVSGVVRTATVNPFEFVDVCAFASAYSGNEPSNTTVIAIVIRMRDRFQRDVNT